MNDLKTANRNLNRLVIMNSHLRRERIRIEEAMATAQVEAEESLDDAIRQLVEAQEKADEALEELNSKIEKCAGASV